MRLIEIGSDFELDPDVLKIKTKNIDLKNLGIRSDNVLFLSTARSAIGVVLDKIEQDFPSIPKSVLVPSYTCWSVLKPFEVRKYKINTYSVDTKFETNPEKFKNEIINSGCKIVLIHSYFGFDTNKDLGEIVKELSEENIIFIEDRTHSLYSDFNHLPVDYVVGSLRKWGALPDGGFASSNKGKFINFPKHYNQKLEYKKLYASKLKYNYLHEGLEKKVYFYKNLKKQKL